MPKNPREENVENSELDYVLSQHNTIVPEEFPEGPYGATVYNNQPINKSTPWEPGQRAINQNQDENPAFSDDIAAPPPDAKLPDL